MNRRDVLKGLTLSLGYAVATPTALSMLQSCSEKSEKWNAVFLNEAEKNMVTHLVDIILPQTDTPGGLDLNLPQFIDLMCNDVLYPADQELFHQGSQVFAKRFNKKFKRDLQKATKEEIMTLFAFYFDKDASESAAIKKLLSLQVGRVSEAEKDDYKMYKCLTNIRSFSLLGYFTSEKIGTEVLNFDPIPGVWKPCIPVGEVGNSWTL